MTMKECKTVRRQVDETGPDQQLNMLAAEHLHRCDECRTFRSEQQGLQGLLSDLTAVDAPSDFYFRLRGRLAREKSNVARNGRSFSYTGRAMAAVTLLLVLAVGGVLVRNRLTSREAVVKSPAQDGSVKVIEPKVEKLSPANTETASAPTVSHPDTPRKEVSTPRRHTAAPPASNALRNSSTAVRKAEGSAVRESAVSPAPVLIKVLPTGSGSVVRVPLDAYALKISINDGRGASRTISLPTVSFGSQRLTARESFLSPLSPPKGVW